MIFTHSLINIPVLTDNIDQYVDSRYSMNFKAIRVIEVLNLVSEWVSRYVHRVSNWSKTRSIYGR